jgi:hypothetical protein
MRAEEDAVARLQGDEGLENDSGGGVGDWSHTHDYSHGLRDLGQAALVIGFDDAC